MTANTSTRLALAAALALGAASAFAQSAAPSQEQLLQRVEALAQELERVKAQLQQMKDAQQKAAQAQPVTPAAAPAAAPVVAAAAPAQPATTLTAYGEINYNRPKDSSQAQADVRRFVLGFQHRFDEKTKVVAELETEHAVVSKDDDGEVEVEQLYVEHRLSERYGVRAGLLLMPIGLLNNNHEPTAYYGVERNFVETAIIPSTWREAGAQVFGEHDNGVSWSAGLSTGFDLNKWDATSSEGRESPLRSIHQEGQLAKAHDLSVFGNIDWRGLPGLRLGAGGFTGKAGHAQQGFAANNARVTLWDLHAQWTPGPWDLSALYTRGTISGAGDLNLSFAGSPYPVPKSFDGWYAQAAYRWQLKGDYMLAPFARYERVNTGRSFDGLPADVNPGNVGTETITTVGVNFQLNPSVVLKADLQRFKLNPDSNRFDLGLGFSF
jgi:hypothetical protein